jgi:hypothetical protein
MKTRVFVLLYLVVTVTVRAEIRVGASLEWLADTSGGVGIYQATESREESDSAFQLSFQLDEALKGEPPQLVASSYWVRFAKGPQPPSVSVGDRFLIFLKPDDQNSPRVAHLINLSTTQAGGTDSVAINSKFEVLTLPPQILATVRGRIKSHPTAKPTKWREYPDSRFDVEVPPEAPAYNVLFSGSLCYLLVPEDLRPPKPNK